MDWGPLTSIFYMTIIYIGNSEIPIEARCVDNLHVLL